MHKYRAQLRRAVPALSKAEAEAVLAHFYRKHCKGEDKPADLARLMPLVVRAARDALPHGVLDVAVGAVDHRLRELQRVRKLSLDRHLLRRRQQQQAR